MIELPKEEGLPIGRLAGAFSNVTNSYKYYWFLAILKQLEDNPDVPIMPKDDLALQMVSMVWYPLEFYKLSFGKQDSFKSIAGGISDMIQVKIGPKAPDLYQQLKVSLTPKDYNCIISTVGQLLKYVPYRFQRPFVAESLTSLPDQVVNMNIVKLADDNFYSSSGKVMYRYREAEKEIEIHPLWLSYLRKHLSILRGYIYFELIRFLQKHNSNVIGLSEKVNRPREPNLAAATKFWKAYLRWDRDYVCPFSALSVGSENFSLDHFIPWSYVVHDLNWNILPIPKFVNSSKGNVLPSIDYLSTLCSYQFKAFKFLLNAEVPDKDILLEDYVQLFGQEMNSLRNIGEEAFNNRLSETMRPLLQIASNLGFKNNWRYKGDLD